MFGKQAFCVFSMYSAHVVDFEMIPECFLCFYSDSFLHHENRFILKLLSISSLPDEGVVVIARIVILDYN